MLRASLFHGSIRRLNLGRHRRLNSPHSDQKRFTPDVLPIFQCHPCSLIDQKADVTRRIALERLREGLNLKVPTHRTAFKVEREHFLSSLQVWGSNVNDLVQAPRPSNRWIDLVRLVCRRYDEDVFLR